MLRSLGPEWFGDPYDDGSSTQAPEYVEPQRSRRSRRKSTKHGALGGGPMYSQSHRSNSVEPEPVYSISESVYEEENGRKGGPFRIGSKFRSGTATRPRSVVDPKKCKKAKRVQKFLKITAVVLCLLGMFIHVGVNLFEYAQYETRSQINPWVPPSYPDALYCTTDYLSDAKLNASGLDRDYAFFLDAYNVFGTTNAGLAKMTKTEFSEIYYTPQYAMHLVKGSPAQVAALQAKQSKNPKTLLKLTTDISKDPSDHLTAQISMVNTLYPIEIESVWSMYGLCNLIHFSKISMNVMKATYMRAVLNLFNQTDYDSYRLFIGPDAHSLAPSFPISIYPFTTYTIGLVVTNMKRINTRSRPCGDYTETERSRCVVDCINMDLCVGPNDCQTAVGETIVDARGNCNRFYTMAIAAGGGNRSECIDKHLRSTDAHVEKCYGNCYVPCTEQRYQVSVAIKEGADSIYISIGYNDPKQQQEIAQSLAIPLNTLLSNLGGSISLWSGASILIVVYYAIDRIADRYSHKIVQTITVVNRKETTVNQ